MWRQKWRQSPLLVHFRRDAWPPFRVGIKIGARIAVVDSTSPGSQNLQGYAACVVVLPKCDERPAARTVTPQEWWMPTRFICPSRQTKDLPLFAAATSPLGTLAAPTAPVSFSRKETGSPTAAAAQLLQGFATFPFVTIGVTNTEVTSKSDADDGAAA